MKETAMCGGGGGGAAEEVAKQSQQDEVDRQERIRQGMDYLNRVFATNPSRVGVDPLGKNMPYSPGRTYYDAQGNPVRFKHHDPAAPGSKYTEPDWSPNVKPPEKGGQRAHAQGVGNLAAAVGGAPPSASVSGEGQRVKPQGWTQLVQKPLLDAVNQSEFSDMLASDDLYGGYRQTGGWGDIYNKAYQAQKDYELPQVQQQFEDAQRQLAFGLARQGISSSSSGVRLNSDLAGKNTLALSGVEDRSNQARAGLQSSVSDEYDRLVSLLNQTGDNAQVANAAKDRAALLAQPQPLESVGPYFQNATASLADMIVSPALRQSGGGSGGGGYGGGGSKGSGRVVGGP